MEHWQSRAAIVGTAVGIGVYEYVCPKDELISEEVDRIRSTKLGRLAVPLVIGVIAGHLLRVIPEQLDPLTQLSKLFPKE